MSAISPNSPLSNAISYPNSSSAKQEEQVPPNGATSDSSSIERAKADGELKRQLQLETKISAVKEELVPLIDVSKQTKISLKTIFLAHLLCTIESIKRRAAPKNQKPSVNGSIRPKLAQLQTDLLTFFYKKDANPSESFGLITQWNSLSQLFNNKKDSDLKQCDLFFWYLPTFLRDTDFNVVNRENSETIDLSVIEDYFDYYRELVSLAELLNTKSKNDFVEFKNDASKIQNANKMSPDALSAVYAKIEPILQINERLLHLIKQHPVFEFKQEMSHISVPRLEFLNIGADFIEKCNQHDLVFNQCRALSQESVTMDKPQELLSFPLFGSSAQLMVGFMQFYAETLKLMQILFPLNTHFAFIKKHFVSLFEKQIAISKWKDLHFPEQSILKISELFFLYFFQRLEELPNSDGKASMESKLFDLANFLNLSNGVMETYQAPVEYFASIYPKLCSLVRDFRTSLQSSVGTESPFHQAFALFADLLKYSPQSLSLLYLKPSPPLSKEVTQQNQKFLILNLKFYRRYIVSINYGDIQHFLDSVQKTDSNIQALRTSIQKYVHAQKWRQNQLLKLIPQEISTDALDSIVKDLKAYFDIFCDNKEDNLERAGSDLDHLEKLLNTDIRLSATLNMAALSQGYWSFGSPIMVYYDQVFPEKSSKKPSPKITPSSFPTPKAKQAKITSVSDNSPVPKVVVPETPILESLSLQAKAKVPLPLKLAHESALNTSLRRIQIETSLENIEYYRHLLSELMGFSAPLSFPLSYSHLMQLFPLLTLEQSTKAVLSHLSYTHEDDLFTHVLFREISSNKTLARSSHNVQNLWELLELKDGKSFKTAADEKKYLSASSHSIIASRYPLYKKTPDPCRELYAALSSNSRKQTFKILQELPQQALCSLALSQKALSFFTKSSSFTKTFNPSFKTLALNQKDPRIQELLDLNTKLQSKCVSWLDHFASQNLPFASMLTNEMLLCKERLKLPQCYAQILSSAPLIVLELSTLLCESLGNLKKFNDAEMPEWESHDLSDFPTFPQTKDRFMREEKALFEMAQSVLKSETRYPKAIYGEVSEDLLKLQTLCQWREAVMPNGWKTEEMLYEMKSTYKKGVSSDLVKDIERDMVEILDRIQARAELAISTSKKILRLIDELHN